MKSYWFNWVQRSIREGTLQLWRHRFLTLTTVFLGVLILLLLNFVFSVQYYTEASLESLQARADFTVPLEKNYDVFAFDALGNDLKNRFDLSLSLLPEEDFGTFSVPERLQIRFNNLAQVGDVFEILKGDRYNEVIASWQGIGERDFVTLVDRLLRLKESVNAAGKWLVIIFLGGGVLLVLNAFRMGLFSRKNEVFVARLVGADSWFIAGPFIWEGLLVGLISNLLAILIFIFVLREVDFLPGGEIFIYLWDAVFAYQILASMAVGMLGAWLAVRRYLTGTLES